MSLQTVDGEKDVSLKHFPLYPAIPPKHPCCETRTQGRNRIVGGKRREKWRLAPLFAEAVTQGVFDGLGIEPWAERRKFGGLTGLFALCVRGMG
jgi:hypothetical protein